MSGSNAARSRTSAASVSNPTGVATRPVRIDDLAFLSDIEERVFDRGYSAVIMRQLLDVFPDLFFVSTYEGSVCGYVVGGLGAGTSRDAWLLSLAVTPEASGKGISGALLDALLAALEKKPADWLKLTVDPGNQDAVRFYERRGFEQVSFEDEYFGPGLPRLVLGRRLG